jgi:Mg2+ and Co2+ transporter CorA
MHDLDIAFKAKEDEYEKLVAAALVMKTKDAEATQMTKVLAVKKEMLDILHQEMAIATSEPSGLEEKRKEIVERLNKVQDEYADMVSSNDKLETLRRIRTREAVKVNGSINTYTIVFGVACFVLLVMVARPSMTPSIPR